MIWCIRIHQLCDIFSEVLMVEREKTGQMQFEGHFTKLIASTLPRMPESQGRGRWDGPQRSEMEASVVCVMIAPRLSPGTRSIWGGRMVSFYENIQLKMVSKHQCTANFTNFM